MSVPRSVVKFRNGNIEFISNVDRVQYTLKELTRAALRDTGKLICNRFRKKYYGIFKRKKGKVGRYTQYWVRSKQDNPDLQVGLKPFAFYGGFQEVGSSKQRKLGLLQKTVKDNIDDIRRIQGKYLSAIEDENRALGLIDESEYEGGANE